MLNHSPILVSGSCFQSSRSSNGKQCTRSSTLALINIQPSHMYNANPASARSLVCPYGAITQHSIAYLTPSHPIPSHPVPQPHPNHHTHLNRHTLRSPPTSVSPSPPSPAPFVNRQTDITCLALPCLALPCLACPFLSPKKRRTRRRKEKKNSQKPVQSSQVRSSQGLNYTTSSDKTKRRGEERRGVDTQKDIHPDSSIHTQDEDGTETAENPDRTWGRGELPCALLCFALLCFALLCFA